MTDVKFCKYNESECLVKSANDILKLNYKGVDEIGLLPFDPLSGKKLLIQQGAADRYILLNEFCGRTIKLFQNEF